MALTQEDLTAISELTSKLLEPMQDDIRGMKDDIRGMKDDIRGMKDDIHRLDDTVSALSDKVTVLQLHVENETDKRLQLLAENHVNLTNKLNEDTRVKRT